MVYQSIQNALELLGLGENEINIYLKLLDEPTITIAGLTKELKLNRTSVYYSLNKLKEKNLVDLKNDYSRKITINSPKNIQNLLQVKAYSVDKTAREFEADLPQILGKFSFDNTHNNFKVYKAKSQLMEVLISFYDSAKNEILFFGSSDDFTSLLDQTVVEFLISRRLKNKISHRILAFANVKKILNLPNSTNDFRQIKFLPKSYSNSNFYHIIDDTIITWNSSQKKAYVIQDKDIASLYKTQFEILWEYSTDQ